jgi:hypothetical protein
MKRAVAWAGILGCSFFAASPTGPDLAGLDEHLRFLEPLIGRQWEGGFVGEETPDVVISLRFEPVLEGRAVKYTREVAALGYASETRFYWSPSRDEVLFLELNSRGIVGEGVASIQDGAIVLRGVDQWPGGSMESKTVLHLDAVGVLRDTFTRMEDGEWVPGHIQEYTAKNSQ